jgi:hypothetical protein
MLDGAAATLCYYSINALSKVSEDGLISYRLWPARAPNLNPCDFYLLGTPPKCIQIILTHWMNLSTSVK